MKNGLQRGTGKCGGILSITLLAVNTESFRRHPSRPRPTRVVTGLGSGPISSSLTAGTSELREGLAFEGFIGFVGKLGFH